MTLAACAWPANPSAAATSAARTIIFISIPNLMFHEISILGFNSSNTVPETLSPKRREPHSKEGCGAHPTSVGGGCSLPLWTSVAFCSSARRPYEDLGQGGWLRYTLREFSTAGEHVEEFDAPNDATAASRVADVVESLPYELWRGGKLVAERSRPRIAGNRTSRH
jgi:hypothetical protein